LDYSGGGNEDLAFNIVSVTLGVFGVTFTGYCIGIFVILRRKAKQRGDTGGGWGKQTSLKWWNKIPRPTFGVSELSGGPGPHDTVELPGEGEPVFKLPAGAYTRVQKEVTNRVGNQY
jgi:hypothetical protein